MFLLRPEMPFLKLLISNYWQDRRAVTPWRPVQLRTYQESQLQQLRCHPCVPTPATIISRVWKQGDESRGTEAHVEEAEKKRGMKKSNSVVSRWNLFPSAHKRWLPYPYTIKGLKLKLRQAPGQFKGQHCHQLGFEDFSIQNWYNIWCEWI